MRPFRKKINISEIDDPESERVPDMIFMLNTEMVAHERKCKRITQKGACKRTGLSQANISNIENGATRPTMIRCKNCRCFLGND